MITQTFRFLSYFHIHGACYNFLEITGPTFKERHPHLPPMNKTESKRMQMNFFRVGKLKVTTNVAKLNYLNMHKLNLISLKITAVSRTMSVVKKLNYNKSCLHNAIALTFSCKSGRYSKYLKFFCRN